VAAPSAPVRPLFLLGALSVVNLLNFIDRQVLFAVFPAVKSDLGLSDAELGLAGSAFIVVYMLVTPITGFLGDRLHRPRLVALGVGLWSAATALSASARSVSQLLIARAAVGVGESCYAPLCTSMIGDSFPPSRRAASLAVFNAAVPVGSALGYLFGGTIGARFGWRAAFYVVGLPGLLLALALAAFPDPARGALDPPGHRAPGAVRVRALMVDPLFAVTTSAMAALTFVLGALAAWLPTFLVRIHGLSLGEAGASFGALTALTGLLGTALGGWLGDRAAGGDAVGYLRVSAIGLLLAAPVTLLAIVSAHPAVFWCSAAVAEVLVFLNVGPLNAVIVGTAAPAIRASAVAANVFAIHFFGDAISPWLVGLVSDRYGLRWGLALLAPILAISGSLCLLGSRFAAGMPEERP
jgi:MFS family permease